MWCPLSGIHYHAAYVAFHGVPPTGTLKANGAQSRSALKKNLPALGDLEKKVKDTARRHKRIKGLDGRYINIRSQHSALNALFQSAGAIIMKKAACLLDDNLTALGLRPQLDYEFVANVHDEFQIEVRDVEGYPQLVADQASLSMTQAGEFFNLRVLIEGESAVGNNWRDTH